MTIERIDIVITEKGGRVVKRSLDDISQSAQKVNTDLKKINKTALVAGAAIGGALAAAGYALFRGFKNAAQSIEDTYKAAKQLGQTPENFSRLEFAAHSADITTQQLLSSIEGLQRAQVQAAREGSPMAKLFKQLNIEAVNLVDGSLRPANDMLRDLADVFQRMPDGADKAALAVKLFGRENAEMVHALNDGSAGLDRMAKKSDELGYTLGTETTEEVHKFYDQLDEAKLSIEGLYRQAIPGLLPQLTQFSTLLNSPDFRNGFNTLIQGAAQAIIWLGKFASTVANVTHFIGEEIAARTGGVALGDTVRDEQRIERLNDAIKAIQDGPVISPIDVLKNPTELFPKNLEELFSGKGKTLKRLQDELDQQKNHLKLGVEINEQAAIDAAAKGREILEEALQPPVTVDWGELGGDTGGGSKAREAANNLDQLQSALNGLIGIINPVIGAEMQLAEAQLIFNNAVQAGLIDLEDANAFMAQYREQLEDQLKPLEAVNREIAEQQRVAALLGDEHDREIQLLNILEGLKYAGIRVDAATTKGLRDQLLVLQEINKLSAAKEQILANSQGRSNEDFARSLQALEELLKSGDITKGDAFNTANDLMGGIFDNTQQMYDQQVAMRAEFYTRIDALRQLDVISEQTAQQAKADFERNLLNQRLEGYSTFFGGLAALASSENADLARIGKAAAIVDATIKGYMAIQNALATVPYPANIAAAAGIAVMTAANIANIASTPLPAFRTGGSMVVGGSGGTDSQTVAFRATPGEQVSIKTPAQARAAENSGKEVVVNSPIGIAIVADRQAAMAQMRQDPNMRQWVIEVIEENNGTVARAIGVK